MEFTSSPRAGVRHNSDIAEPGSENLAILTVWRKHLQIIWGWLYSCTLEVFKVRLDGALSSCV